MGSGHPCPMDFLSPYTDTSSCVDIGPWSELVWGGAIEAAEENGEYDYRGGLCNGDRPGANVMRFLTLVPPRG